MVEIAMHIKCDSRKVCSQCSIYIWKPNSDPKSFSYCATCKHDILCDRGLITSFEYDDSMQAESAKHLCLICRTEVIEKTWPKPTGQRLDMIS